MKTDRKFDISFFLQRFALVLFAIFPVALSVVAQIFVIIHYWNITKFLQFGLLVAVLLVPIFAILRKKSFGPSVEHGRYLPIIWVVGLAIALRVILVPLISTNFVSDMEDTHLLAVDISSNHPLANIDKYPNIPEASYLNMSALVLSFVYKLFGASATNAKLFMTMLGGLTTLLIYLTGREIANNTVGFLAAFLFATMPSLICYTGVLVGDHIAFPIMFLAILIYALANKFDNTKFFYSVLAYMVCGGLIGLTDWFRPIGMFLLNAIIVSVIIYRVRGLTYIKKIVILGILVFAYVSISNLAVVISKNIFHNKIISASQRIGHYLFVGLNPSSNGMTTHKDEVFVRQTYKYFGNDNSGAQKFLIKLAFSRLKNENIIGFFKEKFNLIWSSHDGLFAYSLKGSNDQELVSLLQNIETLLWLIITILMLLNIFLSIHKQSHPAIFAMQLFILGFALLLLFLEVQNRYVTIVIPFSILLGVFGLQDLLSLKTDPASS